MKFKYLSWEDIEKSCLNMYSTMSYDKYKPDIVIGLLWGGVVPTRLFVDFLDIEKTNVKAIYASLYKGIASRGGEAEIIPHYVKEDIEGKKVLLLDDIKDSGKTMNAALRELVVLNCEVKTATLVWRSKNKGIAPDYYDIEIADDTWVSFPWEKFETNRELNK
jgi:hypoxanthine phosphoribosyltransferase